MFNRTLTIVQPHELAAAWPGVRDGMQQIESPDGWLVEDVYHIIKTGGASLHLIKDGGDAVGFLVLRVLHDFDGARLHIWLLWAKESNFDVMAEFSDELAALAKQVRAIRLTFGSMRKGWHKVASKYGFDVRETIFQKVIQ